MVFLEFNQVSLVAGEHIKNILPVIDAALKKANTTLKELDAIAYTQSPGLIGSLLVGAHTAKSLAHWKATAAKSLHVPVFDDSTLTPAGNTIPTSPLRPTSTFGQLLTKNSAKVFFLRENR